MSKDVNILANIANFNGIENGHIGHIGAFHNLDNIQNVRRQFQNNEPGQTYEQGFEEGYAQAENLAQGHVLLANTLKQSLSDMKAEIEAGHRRVVTAVLQAALPALAKKNMVGEIADFIMTLSSGALGGQVELRAHPQFEQILEQIVQTTCKDDDDQTTFTIKTNKNISGNTVQALWQGGGGTIDIENTVRELLSRAEQD